MVKIYLVRHAESIANAQGIYQGQGYNKDLSKLGREQAEALANEFSDKGISKIIASPLRRTMQTVRSLANKLKVPIKKEPLLLETNHGDWEGKSVEMIAGLYPAQWRAWQQTPSQVQMPSGEHTSKTVARALKMVERMRKMTQNTVVASHGNTLQFMICGLDGVFMDSKIRIDSCGYFVLENSNGDLKIVERNVTRHLKGIVSDLSRQAW